MEISEGRVYIEIPGGRGFLMKKNMLQDSEKTLNWSCSHLHYRLIITSSFILDVGTNWRVSPFLKFIAPAKL